MCENATTSSIEHKKKVVEIPPGGSGASASTQSFCVPAACEFKKFKLTLLHKVGLECPHHLMVFSPLNLHSYIDKVLFVGSCHLPKFWGKKKQKQTLRWGDSNETPKSVPIEM